MKVSAAMCCCAVLLCVVLCGVVFCSVLLLWFVALCCFVQCHVELGRGSATITHPSISSESGTVMRQLTVEGTRINAESWGSCEGGGVKLNVQRDSSSLLLENQPQMNTRDNTKSILGLIIIMMIIIIITLIIIIIIIRNRSRSKKKKKKKKKSDLTWSLWGRLWNSGSSLPQTPHTHTHKKL